MVSLILFRHGKSDWDAPFADDHERPLAVRGREAARCMGRMLVDRRQTPDLAVSSSALRARQSLELAVAAGGWNCPIRIDDALYDSSPARVLAWIRRLDASPACLLLTGHEPTWSELAGRLTGTPAPRVPTAAMLRIDFAADDWPAIEFGAGTLRWRLTPKQVCRARKRNDE